MIIISGSWIENGVLDMGFNTSLMIRNDNMHSLKNDIHLGQRIYNAICKLNIPKGRLMYGDLDFGQGEVISQAHADANQLIVVGGNRGQTMEDFSNNENSDWFVIHQMKQYLEKHGYKVTKTRKKNA